MTDTSTLHSQPPTKSERPHLLKILGPVQVWALGVGIVLVGEFMGWNYAVAKGGALGAVLACWIIGVLYVSLVLITTEIGSVIPEAGGQYAMAKYLLGPLAAFNIGLMLVFEYVMLEAADALVIGKILHSVNPAIQSLPFVILILIALTYLNYRGVSVTLNVNFVITAIAFVTIFILLFGTRFYSQQQSLLTLTHLTDELPIKWLGVLGALQFGIWFYLGIEGTALAAEECRSTSRALPIGAIIGVITLLIGASVTWLVCSALVSRAQLGVSDYPLFDAAKMLGSPLVIDALFVGTVLSCLASANGCITDASRAWFAMSRDTLIPDAFASVHPVHKTPYRAILFLLPIAVAFGYAGLLDQVITFSIFSALIVYLFTAIMMLRFRSMYPLGSIKRGFTVPFHPVPAILLFLLVVATLAGMFFGYWQNMLAGILFYFVASMWFVLHRYKFVDFRQFIATGANHWPRPQGL